MDGFIVREREEDRYGMPEKGPFYGPFPSEEEAYRFGQWAKQDARWAWRGFNVHPIISIKPSYRWGAENDYLTGTPAGS